MDDIPLANPNHTEIDTNRRRFLFSSGAALLTTAFLSSCNVMEDIFPGLAKSEKDKTLAFFGDSLTIGAGGTKPYGNVVAAGLKDRPVISNGIVGQLAASIAIRQGGAPLVISIEGNKLNGIKPVKITKLSNQFLSTGSNSHEYSRTGSISGVHCTITRKVGAEQSDMYTITPSAVSFIDIPADSVFVLDDVERLKAATQILWYGRNNIGRTKAGDEIIAALDQSIAYLEAPARYIIPGVLLAAHENKGTDRYKQVTDINTRLAGLYGKSYVPMTPPTDAEMEAISYEATAEDRTDLGNLNFPRGMRTDINTDDIHLNDWGYQIIANRVIAKIQELKY